MVKISMSGACVYNSCTYFYDLSEFWNYNPTF